MTTSQHDAPGRTDRGRRLPETDNLGGSDTTTTDLASLVQAHETLEDLRRDVEQAQRRRNGMVRQLRDQGVSVTEMADALNLTRKAVYLVLENER